jgi:hypothetical protein
MYSNANTMYLYFWLVHVEIQKHGKCLKCIACLRTFFILHEK